eukprot:CAMPEP_0201500892 /NCGR_PEP_ID=MMETSP0151_2-20130828/83299_1 /ASSEMBLY_ACC=CAM_ASM_000257 /TAXON_ID=200890 /ORGANISM="Paramoeba atlantica, Strain 621/1 / CCAP 1560/9" /LENGTH=202 /DNA_ID=CAMNT_0047894363 /DNA_START=1884 /DNA_END=2493 /DNA_ORIENTATION=-
MIGTFVEVVLNPRQERVGFTSMAISNGEFVMIPEEQQWPGKTYSSQNGYESKARGIRAKKKKREDDIIFGEVTCEEKGAEETAKGGGGNGIKKPKSGCFNRAGWFRWRLSQWMIGTSEIRLKRFTKTPTFGEKPTDDVGLQKPTIGAPKFSTHNPEEYPVTIRTWKLPNNQEPNMIGMFVEVVLNPMQEWVGFTSLATRNSV